MDLKDLMGRVTPGPWSVMQPPNWIVDGRGMNLTHIRGWGFLTGHGHKDGGMDHKLAGEQMDANATLIAMAPDLADAVICLTAERAQLIAANQALAAENARLVKRDQEARRIIEDADLCGGDIDRPAARAFLAGEGK